jgi:multicomponent Na+:H+ antiporter subunit D
VIEHLVALPLAIPLVAAAACLAAWRAIAAQRVIAIASLCVLLAAATLLLVAVARGGPLVLAIGNWAAPVGVELRADLAGSLLTVVTAIVAVAIALFALADVPHDHQRRGFWPLLLVLVLAVCGAFLTSDLFNLFVWFELMLIASFVLLALGTTRTQLVGAHVYVLLSVIGSTLFLTAIGLLYATVRTLDFAQAGERLTELSATQPGVVLAIEAVLLVAFGIKAAVFPLMFWLPASYHTPLPAVSALFAALLTKVGAYAMIRITAGVFPETTVVHAVLAAIAIGTMLVGVLGALAQGHLRRLLAFHIVSQIGYMIAGLALAQGNSATRRFALAAALVFIVHNIAAKTTLFLVAGTIRRTRGTESLAQLGGVARSHPGLTAMFLIGALALAGVPPLSGFWAKLAIFGAGLEQGRYVLVGVAAVVGLLTLTSMLKIWLGAFAGVVPADAPRRVTSRELAAMYAATGLLTALVLGLSLAPELVFGLALDAADQMAPARAPMTWSGGVPW